MTHVEERLEAERVGISRRNVLRAGAVGAAVVGVGAAKVLMQPSLQARGLLSRTASSGRLDRPRGLALHRGVPDLAADPNPFTDPLLIPPAATPLTPAEVAALPLPPGPGVGQQNSFRNETHQIWPRRHRVPGPDRLQVRSARPDSTRSPRRRCCRSTRSASRSKSFDAAGRTYPAGTVRTLPASTIYGFNGTFPGPRINAEYGKPVLVRFENHLDENPLNLDRQDFGHPDYSFLTHLHNGHTAPESDGNPHYSCCSAPRKRATRSSPSWTTCT